MSLRGYFSGLYGLSRFRGGPEDMPYAPRLLLALLAGCVAVQAAFEVHYGAGPAIAVAVVAGWLAVLGLLRTILRGRGKAERFVQTAIALASVTLLFNVIVYPLALLLPLKEIMAHPGATDIAFTGMQTLAMLVIGALSIWELCLWVGSLRRALEVSLAGAVLVFLLLLVANRLVAGVFAAGLGGLPA